MNLKTLITYLVDQAWWIGFTLQILAALALAVWIQGRVIFWILRSLKADLVAIEFFLHRKEFHAWRKTRPRGLDPDASRVTDQIEPGKRCYLCVHWTMTARGQPPRGMCILKDTRTHGDQVCPSFDDDDASSPSP
jgi:hypothetical protein